MIPQMPATSISSHPPLILYVDVEDTLIRTIGKQAHLSPPQSKRSHATRRTEKRMPDRKPQPINYASSEGRSPWFVMHWGGWGLLVGFALLWLISTGWLSR